MSDTDQKNDIIQHLARIDKLVTVMRNSYGNYVVQKALNFATGEAKVALADAIYNNIPNIQDKKIRVKWAQILYSAISNDLNFAERYDLEEYLADTPSTATTPGVFGPMVNINDPNFDYNMHGDSRELSPSKNQQIYDSSDPNGYQNE